MPRRTSARKAPSALVASNFHSLELGLSSPVIHRFDERPRALPELAALRRPSVYVLVFDRHQKTEIYVGMTVDLARRIASHPHLRNAENLARLYVIGSSADDLNAGDARILEGLVLGGLGQMNDLLEALNRAPPIGRPSGFERYCALRVFAGAALLLLARDPLLRPVASSEALLGGRPVTMDALGLFSKERSRKTGEPSTLTCGGVNARATIFSACAMLHAGSTVDLSPSAVHHVGGWVCQTEARFSGLIEVDRSGVGVLKNDLRFPSPTYMAGFVLPSRRGQLHLWSHHRSFHDGLREDALTVWRRVDPSETDPVFAEELARAVRSLAAHDPDWPSVEKGDAAGAIAVALRASRSANVLSGKLDISLTGLLACSLRGDPAAQSTLKDLQRRFASKGLIPSRSRRPG